MRKTTPPVFSRSPRHLFGKRTVAKHTKISDETAEILSGLANAADKTESDFIATLIEIRCHGLAVIESLHQNSLAVVSGKAHDVRPEVEEAPRSVTPIHHKRQA